MGFASAVSVGAAKARFHSVAPPLPRELPFARRKGPLSGELDKYTIADSRCQALFFSFFNSFFPRGTPAFSSAFCMRGAPAFMLCLDNRAYIPYNQTKMNFFIFIGNPPFLF